MKQFIIITYLVLSTISTAIYAEQRDNVYTVGVVPQFETRKIHSIWRPILNVLEEKTGYKFILSGSTSIPAFEQKFMGSKFDFAYMNPYHLIIANKHAGYTPLVREHHKMLHGLLVVHQNSDITHPRQLQGQTLAFPSPNALGASLKMRQELHDNIGIDFKSNYVNTHDSVYLNVLLNEVAAGAGVQKTLNRQKNQYQEMLRVIYKTEGLTPHPIAALPSVPAKVREQVRHALLEMGQSKDGKLLLSKIPIKKIGNARLNDYLPLKSLKLERFYVAPSNQ